MSTKSHKSSYLSEVNLKETNALLVSLSHLANDKNIPIIQPEGLAFLKQIILLKKARHILEIGTAIGYSSIAMASLDKHIKIDTIERNQTLYDEAKKHIASSPYKNQISLHFGDALELEFNTDKEYDLIFIDAAKAQNRVLFEKYEKYLHDEGVIIVDNLLFHDLVNGRPGSRNLRQLVRKIDDFNRYIVNRSDYSTTIYPIGDGMSLSIKR